MNLRQLTDQAIDYSFYLLFFLVPLIMTPWNFELFEYNKMMLTYFLTIIIVGFWAIKMLLQGRIIFKRTPFDIPLVLFLLSQIASTLFSINQHTSIWGYYSRFHGGLLSTISYLTLYWAFVSNLDKAKTLTALRYLLASAGLVSLYGILEHFGIDAKYWVQDVQNRVFSTLGQPNWLAAYLAAIIPLALALTIENRKKKTLFLFLSLSVFLFLSLFFTKSRSGIPAALISVVIFFLLMILPKIFSLKKIYLFPLILITSAIILGGTYWTGTKYADKLNDFRYIIGLEDKAQVPIHRFNEGGSPSSDIRKVVWRGAVDIFKANPVFGSGVETFAYSYYNFRPAEHNLLSEWDFLYNKAHNEYFNFLATTGAFGLGSYLLLIGWVLVWCTKTLMTTNRERIETNERTLAHSHKLASIRANSHEYPTKTDRYPVLITALLAGYVSILITNFFGFSVVPVALFFFLIPAFIVVLLSKEEPQTAPAKPAQQRPWPNFAVLVVLFTISYFLFTILRYWLADVAFAEGVRLNKQGEYWLGHNKLQEAIRGNNGEPSYYDELAWSAANLAVVALAQKDQKLTEQLADKAIASSDKALEISPRHLNFYRTRAKMFFRLAQTNPEYLEGALQALLKAKELAPTDAKVSFNLALIQEGLGQKDEAVKTFEDTIKMKSNYLDAHYMLALLYKEMGQTQKAIEQLEYIINNLDRNYPDATKKLEEWKGQ